MSLFAAPLFLAAALGCERSAPNENPTVSAPAVTQARSEREPIKPIPDPNIESAELARLGKRLFFDKRLSRADDVSCASCHILDAGGDDDRARSIGTEGREGEVNAPTVINASLNFAFFWDGRADTLIDQIDGPLLAEVEMHTTWGDVVAKLSADESYREDFTRSFKDGITPNNIKAAIAAFEETLLTPNGVFDQWLKGKGELPPDVKRGYSLFRSIGCVACHQGANVGGNMYQKFGVLGDYFEDRGNITKVDYGRFNVTKLEKDKFVFRVPSLRNIADTAPYFHDGSAKTLPDAIRVMARYQLGRPIDDDQVADIEAFLKSLSGTLPDDVARAP